MKKLVLLLAVIFSVSLFSCGNKAAETTTEPVEGTEVVADVVAEGVETPCCDKDSCTTPCDSNTCCVAEEVVEGVVAE